MSFETATHGQWVTAREEEDIRAVEAMIKRVDYKPGWKLRVGESPVLIIHVPTLDSLTGQPAEFMHGVSIPLGLAHLGEDFVQHWVYEQLVYVETHEAREHFKVDGAMPYFPHDETGRNISIEEARARPPVKPRTPPPTGDVEVYYEPRFRQVPRGQEP